MKTEEKGKERRGRYRRRKRRREQERYKGEGLGYQVLDFSVILRCMVPFIILASFDISLISS